MKFDDALATLKPVFKNRLLLIGAKFLPDGAVKVAVAIPPNMDMHLLLCATYQLLTAANDTLDPEHCPACKELAAELLPIRTALGKITDPTPLSITSDSGGTAH